jgi:integrase
VLVKLRREGCAEVTLAKKRWLLDFAYPAIGERPVAEITAPEVLAVLRKVQARGRYETARRLRSTCGMVFRYAIVTGRAERDPSVDLRGALTAPNVVHRAAIVDPAGIGALLRAIEDYDGLSLTKAALTLAPLVFVRPGDLRKAEWAEFDLEHAEWRIPAAKMKMRRLHRVPLSKQALAIIRDLQAISRGARWLFPSVRSISRPMSENTLECCVASARLQQGADDRSRLQSNDVIAVERSRLLESRCPRASTRTPGIGRCSACLHTRSGILAGARQDDAGLGRLS